MSKVVRWWVPEIGMSEKKFMEKALSRHFPNEGELTGLFENKIAKLVGIKHALAVTSGTAAIFLSLKAIGIGKGDEVIVPDMTFIATINAVSLCGARPVLIDVDPDTLNISLDGLERAITPKTKAVVPVHVSGRAADMAGIAKIAGKNNIHVVEDAAEAFMSMRKGRYLGTFGKTGCFSFSPHKTITTGQGGMIVTADDRVYIRLRELKDQGRPVRGTGGDDKHDTIGYNFKFTDLQAAVGLGQLEYLDSRIERMRERHRHYVKRLKGVDGISLFDFNLEEGELPQWTDAIVENRDALDRYLRKSGIDCRRYWLPIHTQLPYKLADKAFPNSTRLSARALWLPSAFTMTPSEIDYVCDRMENFLKIRNKGRFYKRDKS